MIKVIMPQYILLEDWAAQLILNYPNEPLPLLENENKWQEWGAVVANTGIFKRAAIPPPFTMNDGQKTVNFETWQKWGEVVYNLMANEQNIPT